MKQIELGITTFVETVPDPQTGDTISQDLRIQQIVDEIVLAESVGLSVFSIAYEHDWTRTRMGRVYVSKFSQ